MKHATKQQWQEYFRTEALLDLFRIDPQKNPNAAKWYTGRQIRIARLPEVSLAVVNPVALGIDELVKEIGLEFEIIDTGTPPAIQEITAYATKNGRVDTEILTTLLVTSRHAPYADVVLTPHFLTAGTQHWGESTFTRGTMILALPQQRQTSLGFLKNLAKHEAMHLSGYHFHHETQKVEGYEEPQDCAAYWRASTNYLCDKCKDALKSFWEGIKED